MKVTEGMNRHGKGWILGGVCFEYGVLRSSGFIEGNLVLDSIGVLGFIYSIYLTRFSGKKDY